MKRNRLRKRRSPILKIVIIFVILIASTNFWYQGKIYSPIDENDESLIHFEVSQGESVKSIAAELAKEDLIKDETAFYLYTKFNELGPQILAGRFMLNKTMDVPEILDALINPQMAEAIVTIQEGLTIKDIDQKLADLDLSEAGEFLEAVKEFNGWEYYSFLKPGVLRELELPLEGYIYPDTYFIDAQNFKAQDLIYISLDNFEKKWESIENITHSDIAAQYSVPEIITMASIIESEVFGYEDRQLVAGILWKRLESSWTIGADATLLYITDDREINADDLALDSPYNTRKNLGLPPGPIANPSLESIRATLFPKESNNWFYLTTLDTGEVIYAHSNEEHNVNRAKYLQ
jgi:UPF0755 protein